MFTNTLQNIIAGLDDLTYVDMPYIGTLPLLLLLKADDPIYGGEYNIEER